MKVKVWIGEDVKYEGMLEFSEEEARLLRKAAGIERWKPKEHRYSLFKCLRFLEHENFILKFERAEYLELIKTRVVYFSYDDFLALKQFLKYVRQLQRYFDFLVSLKKENIKALMEQDRV